MKRDVVTRTESVLFCINLSTSEKTLVTHTAVVMSGGARPGLDIRAAAEAVGHRCAHQRAHDGGQAAERRAADLRAGRTHQASI